MKKKLLNLKYFIITILCLHSLNLFAQPAGSNMSNPIDAGIFPGASFTDSQNNSPNNDFGDDWDQPNDDIFYKITITVPGVIKLNHCSSSFDTYVHLIDPLLNILGSNDDSEFCEGYLQSALNVRVMPGTYYVISEAYGFGEGDIATNISFEPDGSEMTNAISIGTLSDGTNYNDVRDNSPNNNYTNSIGNASDDIFHSFTLTEELIVSISHCNTYFDTYVRFLNSYGSPIQSEVGCLTGSPGIKVKLQPGDYYFVSESDAYGYGNYYDYGEIQINIRAEKEKMTCGTPDLDTAEFKQLPWIANNNYLESFLDSIGYPQEGSSNQNNGEFSTLSSTPAWGTKYWIPVKFHYLSTQVRPKPEQIRALIQYNNKLFADNKTGIQFYVACQPNLELTDYEYFSLDRAEAKDIARENSVPYVLNVFICGLYNNKGGGTIVFNEPIHTGKFRAVFVTKSVFDVTNNLFAHETGHYLDLLHTHHYYDDFENAEPIDRNRKRHWASLNFKDMCEFTGDGLRDTPADHHLGENNACVYQDQGKTDFWGDSYFNPPTGSDHPSAINVMSYNNKTSCTTNYTRMQKAVMLHWLEKKESNKVLWNNKKYIADSHEPNNNYDGSDSIIIGETQLHNFNFQPALISDPTSCDVDWVKFPSKTAGSLQITTSSAGVVGYSDAFTKLTLYETHINNSVATSNQSGSGNFSQITYNFKANTNYYIKIENRQPPSNGFYNLTMGCNLTAFIQGPEFFCENATYTITTPPNATVTWSNSENWPSEGPTTGNSYKILSQGGGMPVIYANITAPCSLPFVAQKQVVSNNPQPAQNQYMVRCWETPNGTGGYHFEMDPYPGAISYEWFTGVPANAAQVFQNGTNVCSVGFYVEGTYSVFAKVTTACGDLYLDQQQFLIDIYNSNFSYSPNPAGNELMVSYGERLTDNSTAIDKMKKPKKDFEARLMGSNGRILKSGKNKDENNKVTLDTREIPEGTYYLHIVDGKKIISKQIIIKH